jgi:transposase
MKNNTARKISQVPHRYLIMGIDPHKKIHVAVAMTQDTIIHTKFKFANSRQGYEQVMRSTSDQIVKTGSTGVIFAIETGGHYWRNLAYFLDEQGIPFRLINPFTLKRMREGKDINRRKTDFRDAEMAAELLRNGEFVETKLPKGIYAELRATYSAYRRLVKERSRAKNLLKGLLDGLFPEFNQVFKNICGMTSLDVLALCPAPKTITGMKLEEFVDAIRKGFKGRAPKVQKLHAIYSLAQASAGIETGAVSVSIELSFLVQRLRLFTEQIERLEDTLVRLVKSIPDARYLLSIVGISYISVAGILAELGPLGEYQSAGQLIKMAGTNPIEWESAGKRGSHTPMSKKGRPGLRWCIWTAAMCLLRHNTDFRSWAKERRERPAHLHPLKAREVFGAVANRLLRLAYALVKNQTFYQTPKPKVAPELELVAAI